jgi:hypothetical protein
MEIDGDALSFFSSPLGLIDLIPSSGRLHAAEIKRQWASSGRRRTSEGNQAQVDGAL